LIGGRIAFALRKYRKLFEISRFPVAQVGFLDHQRRADSPTQLGLVRESDVEIKHMVLEYMIDPIHGLAMDTGILFAAHDVRGGSFTRDLRFVIGDFPPLALA
jgi:hypothetical protein